MNKLTKSDVRSAMLRSMCYQWQSFNYETMQSPGFAQMIAPSIEKIYEGDDELISKKVEQYLSTFYNTETPWARSFTVLCLHWKRVVWRTSPILQWLCVPV